MNNTQALIKAAREVEQELRHVEGLTAPHPRWEGKESSLHREGLLSDTYKAIASLVAAIEQQPTGCSDHIEDVLDMVVASWQPIETAPKDVPVFLAYQYPNKKVIEHIRKHHDPKAKQTMLVQVGYWHVQNEYWMYNGEKLHDATHWMPRPNPPGETMVHDYTATVDHVVPLSKGGANTVGNVVAACRTCNLRKANNEPSTI